MTPQSHVDDFTIIAPWVEIEGAAEEPIPEDLCGPSSIHTTETDEDFLEVVLATADVSPACHQEQSASLTAPLWGKKSTTQAVSARYSLTTIIRIPSKGCKTCEAYPGSWTRCILHAAVEPRHPAADLELEEDDKPAPTPNRTSIATNGMPDPVQKIVIYRSTSHGSRSFLARADTASEYIWLD